jgi:hypothetical protein
LRVGGGPGGGRHAAKLRGPGVKFRDSALRQRDMNRSGISAHHFCASCN